MSHKLGKIVQFDRHIGPASGAPSSPGMWEFRFEAPLDDQGAPPRLVMLHFSQVKMPGSATIEIRNGVVVEKYDARVGTEFWTRPFDPRQAIVIRFISPTHEGGVVLQEYVRGEPTDTANEPGSSLGSRSNPDVFLHDDPYVEPTYETRLKCGEFDWLNGECASQTELLAMRATCILLAVIQDGGARAFLSCTGTLVGEDMVLTAGHCVDGMEVESAWVCFDYQTTCDGRRPDGYAPSFHKVRSFRTDGTSDWAILLVDGVPGIVPSNIRRGLPEKGEPVFTVHHPNGAVKKLQRGHVQDDISLPPGFADFALQGFDFAGGSSGSALFDAGGRMIGVLSTGPVPPAGQLLGADPCRVGYVSADAALVDDRIQVDRRGRPYTIKYLIGSDGTGFWEFRGTLTITLPDGREITLSGPISMRDRKGVPGMPPSPEPPGLAKKALAKDAAISEQVLGRSLAEFFEPLIHQQTKQKKT